MHRIGLVLITTLISLFLNAQDKNDKASLPYAPLVEVNGHLAEDTIDNSENSKLISIFMDCKSRNCDFDHFRKEIRWVNWVRDRKDCHVHILITSERTGGGGLKFSLDYIGCKDYKDQNKLFEFITQNTDSDTEVRNQLTCYIAVGLVQFVELSSEIISNLHISYDSPIESQGTELNIVPNDPWRLWAFRFGTDGYMDGEISEKSYGIEGSISANKVSEELKINLFARGEFESEEFKDNEGNQTFIAISEDYLAKFLIVRSLGPKLSIGGTSSLNRSTYLNRKLAFFIGPSIEYNIFPYSESTRKAITFMYTCEMASFTYISETVNFKQKETLPRHVLKIGVAVQQPWGEIFGSIEGIQYLHDLKTHRINTYLSIEYRIFRGFNVDIFVVFSRIKDQFYLPAQGLTLEEILLRRRQRETDYRFDVGLGFSYRFGSKYANIVNSRMSRIR
jgi:hypothetical protein